MGEPAVKPKDWAKISTAVICILVGLVLCIGSWIYGPQAVIKDLLSLLPEKPGWGWFIGWGLVVALSIIFFLPFWPPMCIGAGYIFGFYWGTVLNFFAIFLAAFVAIVLGRFVLQEPVREWIEQSNSPRLRRMARVLEDTDQALKFQVLFRFLFIPMFIRNYLPSTLNVPLWTLTLASLPHTLWISLVFASIGESFTDLGQVLKEGDEFSLSLVKWQSVATILLSIVVALLLSFYAHHQYNAMLEKEEAESIVSQSQPSAFY